MSAGSPTSPGSSHPAPDPLSGYLSPLGGRYASERMQELWSERRKFESWRRFWLALAEAQHELGLPVSSHQVEAIASS